MEHHFTYLQWGTLGTLVVGWVCWFYWEKLFSLSNGLFIHVRYELSIHENYAFRSFSFSTCKKIKKKEMMKNEKKEENKFKKMKKREKKQVKGIVDSFFLPQLSVVLCYLGLECWRFSFSFWFIFGCSIVFFANSSTNFKSFVHLYPLTL